MQLIIFANRNQKLVYILLFSENRNQKLFSETQIYAKEQAIFFSQKKKKLYLVDSTIIKFQLISLYIMLSFGKKNII